MTICINLLIYWELTVNDMHQIIRSMKYKDIDLTVNITPDIIEILESYGYKVIRPNEREE